MSTLLAVKTGSGKVTVTETTIIIEAYGGRKSESIARAQIATVDKRTVMSSFFGLGGLKSVTIHTNDGRHITLHSIKPRDADALAAAMR